MNSNETVSIDKIIENLIYLHPLLSKSLTRSIRTKTSLNPGSLYILGILSKHEILSMSEIGCKLSMPKPHVTAQVDKLIAEEMVERLFDPNDRRIINIRITEKGITDFNAIKFEISQELRLKLELLEADKLKTLSIASQQVKDILINIVVEKSKCNSSSC